MTRLHQVSCSYREPLWGARIKLHHIRSSRVVEISDIILLIAAYILKVVFPTTFSSRKCNFHDEGVQQILVHPNLCNKVQSSSFLQW